MPSIAALVEHHVRDAAHEVLAEPDLRVHHAGTREDLTVDEVDEVTGDRRGPDVDRDAERSIVETGPDRDDVPATVHCDRDPVRAGGQRRLKPADDREVRAEVVQVPLGSQRVEQPAQVAGRRREIRLADVYRMQSDDRIHLERSSRQVLANDLAMDLALRRDVDDGVAEQAGGARQAPIGGQPLVPAIGLLDGVGLAQVVRRGRDAVLRERPECRHDGTPTADPAPATHGVDVDAE
jgi:hypothetical protein